YVGAGSGEGQWIARNCDSRRRAGTARWEPGDAGGECEARVCRERVPGSRAERPVRNGGEAVGVGGECERGGSCRTRRRTDASATGRDRERYRRATERCVSVGCLYERGRRHGNRGAGRCTLRLG